jgi:O-acetyl-ADP-ribose deacetylase (regulator of RNase III)
VFILRPDDLIVSRGTTAPAVRDNVLVELGMFVGRLGRDRTFLMTPRGVPVRLPSDLLGLTTAEYDAQQAKREVRPAVGPACTRIREQLGRLKLRALEEPESRRRLDRAMSRMSRDLEWLLGGDISSGDVAGAEASGPEQVSGRIGKATVELALGRIQDCRTDRTDSVVALPANEYFDDECITDTNSSLGAFVQDVFGPELDEFLDQVREKLDDLPSQRVSRAERRIDDSYGIGQAIFLSELPSDQRVILVSATTERVGIGLRAEPHFLYAAMQGIFETMNANRLTSVSMPVLGSGHGGMPLSVALLFNLLALRSILGDDIGRHVRHVQVVVFKGAAAEVSGATLRDLMSRIAERP